MLDYSREVRPTRWGEAIQRLLLERGWSQKQLAGEASVRPNALTNIIRHGKHTDTSTLSRIASAFNVDLEELFVTREQIHILRAYHENRVQRIKETVLSEVSATITRLVREDDERQLAQELGDRAERQGLRRARRKPRKH